MSNIQSIQVTPRVHDYIHRDVPKNQQAIVWSIFRRDYNRLSQLYESWKKIYGPKRAYKEAIELMDTQHAEMLNKEKSSCKMGCSACCHYHVDSQDIEVQIILAWCKKHNVTIDKEYLQEQSKWKTKDLFNHPTHSACVFLKDRKCSIYDVRPLACRNYFVFSNPDYCDAKKYPIPEGAMNYNVRTGFYFPSEVLICVIAQPDDSKRGWLVDLLLKNL